MRGLSGWFVILILIIYTKGFYLEHENFQMPSDKNSVILYAVICFGGNREWLEQF